MERFFATLPFGKIAWRSNRLISTDGESRQARGPHQHQKGRERRVPQMEVPRKLK